MMKKTLLLYIPFVLACLFSCVREDVYEQGAVEDPDCVGVYFPRQSSPTSIELEPGGATEVTYKVRRSNILEDIIVPVEVKASEEEIFFVEHIHFAAGDSETTFKVYFPEAKSGVEYTLELNITDPHYVKIYGNRTTSLSISLIIASWNSLGMGKWRDDIISSMYNANHPFAEIEVEIFEREDRPGYIRMKPFTEQLVHSLFDVTIPTENKWIYVDASDSNKVYIPVQATGLTLSTEQGEMFIGSYSDRDFSLDAADSQWGTMRSRVITFPTRGLLCRLDKYMAADEWIYVNGSGKHRIILPGGRVYDYSINLSKSEPENGVVDISLEFGQDVAYVKYALFEGALTEGEISLKAQDLNAGELAFCDEVITASDTLSLSPQAGTGMYTIIACAYDAKSSMQDYSGLSFGYISAGDSVDVDLNFGVEKTNEFGAQGLTSANSLRFYAYGKDIESLSFGLFKKSKVTGDIDALLSSSGNVMTADELSAVNGRGYSEMLTGLNGDSDYVLVLKAYNGYVSKIFTSYAHTDGKFNPILEVYDYSDFSSKDFTIDELTCGQWHLYGTNLMDKYPTRRYLGEVTIKRDDYDDGSHVDFVGLYGYTGLKYDNPDDGKVLALYLPSAYSGYKGTLAPYADQTPIGQIDGYDVYMGYVPMEDTSNIYMGLGQFGGKVSDECIYFVPAPTAQEQGYTFFWTYIGSSNDIYALYEDLLIVKADSDPGLGGSSSYGSNELRTYSSLYPISSAYRKHIGLKEAKEIVRSRSSISFTSASESFTIK